jgi:hypothetical protein
MSDGDITNKELAKAIFKNTSNNVILEMQKEISKHKVSIALLEQSNESNKEDIKSQEKIHEKYVKEQKSKSLWIVGLVITILLSISKDLFSFLSQLAKK